MTMEDMKDTANVVRRTFKLSLNMETEDLLEEEKEVKVARRDGECNKDWEDKSKYNFKLNALNSPL